MKSSDEICVISICLIYILTSEGSRKGAPFKQEGESRKRKAWKPGNKESTMRGLKPIPNMLRKVLDIDYWS